MGPQLWVKQSHAAAQEETHDQGPTLESQSLKRGESRTLGKRCGQTLEGGRSAGKGEHVPLTQAGVAPARAPHSSVLQSVLGLPHPLGRLCSKTQEHPHLALVSFR